MELRSELEASLREFALGALVEIRENGSRVAAQAAFSWEIHGTGARPLLHVWSEGCNLTRRVLAITGQSEQQLALAVERFGRSSPGRLEFVRVEFERDARAVSREEFAQRLRRVLAEQFPDEQVESLTVAADLEHSFSGSYVRGILRNGPSCWALLAVRDGEAAEVIESSLTFALLWHERARQFSRKGMVAGIRTVLPGKFCGAAAARARVLRPGLRMEIYAHDSNRETLERVDPQAAANTSSWLVPRRESEALLAEARSVLAPICAAAPHAITARAAPQSREVVLRFRGITFARWREGRIYCGLNDPREELALPAGGRMKKLLHALETFRHPLAGDTRHALYRAQPERWLESLVMQDVSRVDANLDQRFVYSQVIANAGGEHGILDVLTVTRSGRLAILELKTSESIHLPLQAAEYWQRIRRHQLQKDLARYGYFPGIELQSAPPIIYLVAPALRFHPTTDVLLRELSPEIEVTRVGIAESWRRGLRVVMRQ